jgi:hypothetical protein
LEADPAYPPDTLIPSIASLPPLPSGENPFVAQQNRLRAYVDEDIAAFNATLTQSQQSSQPLERPNLDRARFLYRLGRLNNYKEILVEQWQFAGSAGRQDLVERIDMYLRELESGQYLTIANPYPSVNSIGQNLETLEAVVQAV